MDDMNKIYADYLKDLDDEYELYTDGCGQSRMISKKEHDMIEIANYLISYPRKSIREIARDQGIPKSTIYQWITHDLKFIDDELYQSCKHVLETHKVTQY